MPKEYHSPSHGFYASLPTWRLEDCDVETVAQTLHRSFQVDSYFYQHFTDFTPQGLQSLLKKTLSLHLTRWVIWETSEGLPFSDTATDSSEPNIQLLQGFTSPAPLIWVVHCHPFQVILFWILPEDRELHKEHSAQQQVRIQVSNDYLCELWAERPPASPSLWLPPVHPVWPLEETSTGLVALLKQTQLIWLTWLIWLGLPQLQPGT